MAPGILAAIGSWHHRDAVRRLVLDASVVDGPACTAVADALPGPRELSCWDLDPVGNSPPGAPAAAHTALTSLRTRSEHADLAAAAARAPRLRHLEV
jgi:hypothetical protein